MSALSCNSRNRPDTTARTATASIGTAPLATPDRTAPRVLLLLVGLAIIAGCRDTTPTAPPSLAPAGNPALASAADPTLPVHIRQDFVPETEHSDYASVPCGSGTSLPNRFRADGVLTPSMGRTRSVLVAVACSLGADSIRVAGLVRHVGATGDTAYGVWGGFITNPQGRTGTLTLRMVLVRGTGRFQHMVGDLKATGELDLVTRAGSYSGTGSLYDRPPLPPRAVQPLPQTVSTGYFYSCGLSDSGNAYCWGRNATGQVGDGTTTSRAIPTAVVGGLTFTQISTSHHSYSDEFWNGSHTCGITPTGAAYCWGGNGYGQLGDGTTTSRSTPTLVGGGLTFTQISTGYFHTCGVTTTGAAYCWGQNHNGQLGNGEGPYAADRPSPTAVLGGIVFRQISAGESHTCGITPAGVAFCWGYGYFGQLGMGSRDSPVFAYPVAGGLLFKEISAGSRHTCGVSTSGTGYCWGANTQGQVGNGGLNAYPDPGPLTPSEVAGGLTFARISAGDDHSCGVTTSGPSYCWGSNSRGQLGNGTSGEGARLLTPSLVQGGIAFRQISAGGYHTCVVANSGVGYCWGGGDYGALGDGTSAQRNVPTVIEVFPASFDRLSGGGYHTCALTLSDAAYCWGANYSGQLGDGTTNQRFIPAEVVGGVAFDQISGGYSHSCALTTQGAAYCWGENLWGQLGDGTTTDRASPAKVSGALVFSRIRAGTEHSCGIASTRAVYCWGGNEQGQLGDGTTTSRSTPTQVAGGHLFAELVVGSYHSCALTNAGEAYCWGGDGVNEYHVPTAVTGSFVFTQLSAGRRFTCGLSGGAAYCWGGNSSGQLGNGTTVNQSVATPVSGGRSFDQLATGQAHTCAITSSGSAYCWGDNVFGQLGDGSTTQRTTPVAVAGGLPFSRISVGLDHSCGVSASTVYCWGRGDYGQTGGGTRLIPETVTALRFGP